ncbi:MAG: type II toxin-antitoxin system VapC family toxin, partial [Beijerinckiaceae bacterium]
SAWIEWMGDSATGRKIAPFIVDPAVCIVPTIVQFELAKYLARHATAQLGDQLTAYTSECAVVDLTTTRAVHAAELSRTHKLAMADAIIYACAIEHQAELMTCDAHFKDLPGVVYFDKA